MLKFVIGEAGSGKSEYIEKVFFEQARQGDNRLMIIVPDQYSYITERSVLEKLGAKYARNIKIARFDKLADDIIGKFGGVSGNILTPSGKVILMAKAMRLVSDDLTYYKKQSDKVNFINEMIRLGEELRLSQIEATALFECAEKVDSSVLKAKLCDISLIYGKYSELVRENYLNPEDRLSAACTVLESNECFSGYTVAVDSFGFFDNQKLDFILHIFAQCRDSYITLCTDSLSKKDSYDKFANIRKTARKIAKLADEKGIKRGDVIVCGISENISDEFKYINKGIFEANPQVFGGKTDNVVITASENMNNECETAAVKIKKLVMFGDYRYRDIAVIIRDDAYIPALKRAFLKHDIPFFEDMRRSISNEPLSVFIHNAFRIVTEGFKSDDIIAYLKSGITGIPSAEISALENYCIVWNINGIKKWSADFSFNPRGFTERTLPDDEHIILELNETRKRVIAPLIIFKNMLKKAGVKDICTAVYELLKNVNAPENIKASAKKINLFAGADEASRAMRVWNSVMDILNFFAVSMREDKVSIKEFALLFDAAVISEKLGEIPQGLDEITVGRADRIRTDVPRASFILGANEGVFPQAYASGGLLSDSDKLKLGKLGIEYGMSCEKMNIEEKFFAYCAVTSPSEKLYISYAESKYDGTLLLPSRIVSDIKKIIPNCVVKNGSLLSADDIVSASQGFALMAEKWNENSVLSQTLKDYFANNPDYVGRVGNIIAENSPMERKVKNPELCVKLYGENISVSPSKVDVYYKCPFMYFCENGLKIEDIEPAALDRRTGGSLIHFVLENFVRDTGKEALINMEKSEIISRIDKYTDIYVSDLNLPDEFADARFRFVLDKNKKIILATLLRMAEEMRHSDFEPVDFELPISRFSDIKSFELPLEKGKIAIRGTVDRVDLMKKDGKSYIRVIDYKSGTKDFELGEVLHGLNTQMLLYLLAITENGESRYGEIIPSGVLYVPATNVFTSEPRNTDASKLASYSLAKQKMKGFVLSDEKVIKGMEYEAAGRFIPAKIGKSGVPENQVLTDSEMEALNKRLKKMLIDYGNGLHSGKIDDSPVYIKGKGPCTYCRYKNICRNENKQRETAIPDFSEARKILGEETCDG